jgi:hypothetical protein
MEDAHGPSKRSMKRQARQEQMREERKRKRQVKLQEKREAKQQYLEQTAGEHVEWVPLPHEPPNESRQDKRKAHYESFKGIQSPMTIAIDCAFERYMTEGEKKVRSFNMIFSFTKTHSANHRACISRSPLHMPR